MPGKLFIVSGPSGADKTMLVNTLINDMGDSCSIERVVTYTTRAPRAYEVMASIIILFLKKQFKEKEAVGFFCDRSSAYGNYYGMPKVDRYY